MTGKDIFFLQQAVDDSHVTDLVGFSWILVDGFASAALRTVLVNERSELISEVDLAAGVTHMSFERPKTAL